MALHTYDESNANLQSLLASDPNRSPIINYLIANSPLPDHDGVVELATGSGTITDLALKVGGHSYQPELVFDQEGSATINLSSFTTTLKYVVEASNEALTTSGSKPLEIDLLGRDTLTASSSTHDSISSGSWDSIKAGAYDTIAGGYENTIVGGANDSIVSGGYSNITMVSGDHLEDAPYDTIQASGSGVYVIDGTGHNTITAGTGAETLVSGGGGDWLNGSSSNVDWVLNGSNDTLALGLHGSDTIQSPEGLDLLLAHTADHYTVKPVSGGGLTISFSDTKQVITLEPGGTTTIHFAGSTTPLVEHP